MRRILEGLRWSLAGALLIASLVVGIRAWQAWIDPDLAPWHRFVPPEPDPSAMDGMDWDGWLAAEARAFDAVKAEVTDTLALAYRVPENRYFAGSPMHAPAFERDWNRSALLLPEGPPRGAAVLVHGLTDSPYSLRHVAEVYRRAGFIAILPRMPGHGTVPGGLSAATWGDWLAAVRLAVRTAREMTDGPLHLVGYSNGGALVTKYAIDALADPALARPERIVLFSPMIGVTAFARFAGLAGLPAVLPPFVRAGWFDILPEFNPFKYNSFPVQAAVQSHRLTRALRADLIALARNGRIADLPPILTFQSVVDFTVSTRALVTDLYGRLAANGSTLVLVDLNRAAVLAPLISRQADAQLAGLLPPRPRAYDVVVITNRSPRDPAAIARRDPAGDAPPRVTALGLAYPRDVFSLSHVALPFPVTDGLYGLAPAPGEDFGIRIGTLAARGETGVLAAGTDMFARLYSNPFLAPMLDEIAATLGNPK